MNELKGMFITVSSDMTNLFKVLYKKDPDKYKNKIIVLEETNLIIIHGIVFDGTKF